MIESAEEYDLLMGSDIRDEERRFKWDSASESTWRDIIDRYPQHRVTVAMNVTLPESIQEILARDEDEDVRMMLAGRRRLSSEVFEILAADVAESVRAHICANRKTPEALLVKLSKDSEPWVARCARERLAALRYEPET
jgi:hypothetical protein